MWSFSIRAGSSRFVRFSRPWALALLVTLVAGCGFRPVYATKAVDAAAEPAPLEALAATEVAPIADRPGQLLRNELVFLFSAWGEPVAPRYSLGVTLSETLSTTAVQITGLATRANLRLNARYALTDLATGQIVLRGQADAFGSYDLLPDEFATLIAERFTREQAVERLARILHMRLAAFHGTRAVAGAGTATGGIATGEIATGGIATGGTGN
jgi:LPS-assembly lipoprotein